MRRDTSDMESDFDEVFTDDPSKGSATQINSRSQLVTRKRRRGIIEKRRRDRINNSLSELRRLVPAAFEKQGSAKLEKAEILQMTVDHLRTLHSKGFDIFNSNPNQFSMDYHNIGFRECVSEIARYLVGMEGMDLQDPLRLRLMSHLQCYAAQRDLAIKCSNPWSPTTPIIPENPGSTSRYESTSSLHVNRDCTRSTGEEAMAYSPPSFSHATSSSSAPVKPYRPWGTELAY